MAKQSRTGIKTKKRPLRYFFLNGHLHKKLFINRGKDQLTAWDYFDAKKVMYNYSDTLKKKETAFDTGQVAYMLNRRPLVLRLAILEGMISRPQFVYGLDENKRIYKYMWSEKEILQMHDYLSNVHRGRPRKDGRITTWMLPTPRELKAMIRDETILYVKQGDKFVPTWQAKEF